MLARRVRSAGLFGMLIYSSLVALYFIGLGVAGECVGKLLWPAAVVHVILTIFLAGVGQGTKNAGAQNAFTEAGSEKMRSL